MTWPNEFQIKLNSVALSSATIFINKVLKKN